MRFDVHELPERRVQREAVHPVTLEGYDELRGGSVHAVPSHEEVVARPQDVVHCSWLLPLALLLVDAKNGAGANIAVDVAATVKWVERNNEASPLRLGHEDGILVLLGNQNGASATVDEGVNENVVGQHVKLLLVVASGIHLGRQANPGIFPGRIWNSQTSEARNRFRQNSKSGAQTKNPWQTKPKTHSSPNLDSTSPGSFRVRI
mmetsp:Transcript_4356/g.10966  ORF Transcript_4356/g.10966 Transcript_4356/m.10966 type:complete len:205 (-) Transcript_4356:110-724(-)